MGADLSVAEVFACLGEGLTNAQIVPARGLHSLRGSQEKTVVVRGSAVTRSQFVAVSP